MRISGVQYYWLVLVGLLLGLVGGGIFTFYESKISGNPIFILGALVLMVFSGICYLNVVLEMWSLWRMRLIGAAIVTAGATSLVHPWFSLFFLLGPLAHWVWRIKGSSHVSRSA
tara:strand:+ start:1142 stop:1483 length:342 start_codon:yes stop_codon:yes gene_type:complete